MASLDSPDVSIFSPASPEVKIRGMATRKFKKERIREAANLFVRNEEERKSVEPVEEEDDDDSLSFKHGKDNTFDRLCAKDRGKNGEGNVGRGRVRSPFSPVDDNSKVAETVFSSSGEYLEATPTSYASVFSSDASGGGLFATPKEREDSEDDDDKPLRAKKTAAKTVPKRRVTKKPMVVEKGFSDSMLQYCKRPVQSRETSSASDGNGSLPTRGDENGNGAEEDEDEVISGGEHVLNVEARVSLLQLDGSPGAVACGTAWLTSTPIGDSETGAKHKG